MKRLTIKGVTNYLDYNYGGSRHDVRRLVIACRKTGSLFNAKPIDIFWFMIENDTVPGIHTHSYGFHTAVGREIRETFKWDYYNNF
tara:strand:+ start:256 stop:513 length:258 start_codon:yes stop_codon:yes gene_type:complete